jgi:cbb3-type cytochrome oxidase maturation protein
MSVMIIILIISMSIAGGFLIAFLWSVKNGQFDDDFSPAQRAIFDDKTIIKTKTNSNI